MGPTFIKLGQLLSVREDVLGPVWAAEICRLQDGVAPVAPERALATLAESFSADAFVSIEPVPVATASIAQVHRAVWRAADGASVDVAVKVLRPGGFVVPIITAFLVCSSDNMADVAIAKGRISAL